MFDRTQRELRPFVCRISNLGGRDYIVWGRFRIRLLALEKAHHVFEDQYEITEVNASLRSRNNIYATVCKTKTETEDHLVAMHIILPNNFKGKCIRATNGRRVFYDYSKKGSSPNGYFSVMALVHIPNSEIVTIDDWDHGQYQEIVMSNHKGSILYNNLKIGEESNG